MPAASNGLLGEPVAAEAPQPGAAFVRWLQGSGLPESLWDQLLTKIAAGDTGAGSATMVRHVNAAEHSGRIRALQCSIPRGDG